MRIDYVSESFPAGGAVTNGPAQLETSWDDVLWAALTVGRPNRAAVFQHGNASLYEAIFRLSLVRMALEQAGPTAVRFRRTDAARTLDPSEKGAINYFIGMTVCKLFADRLLSAAWMLHLDVFRPQLDPVLTGRSRPDLVGQRTTGDWIAVECKGRISEPDAEAKKKAKQQAQRCVSVGGMNVQLHIGAITYFRNDVLQFYWLDPQPDHESGGGGLMTIQPIERMWQYHYQLALALTKENGGADVAHEMGVEVAVHPEVLRRLRESQWDEAKTWCQDHAAILTEERFRADGLRVTAGDLWRQPFEKSVS